MLAPFQSLCARTCAFSIQIHEYFNIKLPMAFSNLRITKTLLVFGTCKYMGRRRFRRDARIENNLHPPPVAKPGWSKGPCGMTSRFKIQFNPLKRSLRDAFPARNIILSTQKAPAERPSVIPKAKCMTLGPKFFCCSKMAVTRRRSKLW